MTLPWPGMPTDNPTLPLDLEQLPGHYLLKGTQFYPVSDKFTLLARIERLWVPHLNQLLWFRV